MHDGIDIRPLSTLLGGGLMRTRNLRTKRHIQKVKGDLLAQKWMTNLLTFILILLIFTFITLSIPSVKNHVVNFVRVLLYGKEQAPQRPNIAPVRLHNPFQFNILSRGNLNAYPMEKLLEGTLLP